MVKPLISLFTLSVLREPVLLGFKSGKICTQASDEGLDQEILLNQNRYTMLGHFTHSLYVLTIRESV